MTLIKQEENPNDEMNKIFDKLFTYIPDLPDSKEKNDKAINEINEIFDSSVFLDDFSPLVEEVKCPVCLQVSLKSLQCSKCRGIICEKCNKKNLFKICPICNDNFEGKELDRVLKNVMGHMLIRCANCKQYRNKIFKVKISQIQFHLSNCEYSNYQCLVCNQKILHSKMKCIEHALVCGYSDVICNFCNKKIKLYLQNSHEKKCSNEVIKCYLCNKEIIRKNFAFHKQEECEFRKIKCKYCNTEYIFKEGHTKEKCQEIQILKLKMQNKELCSILNRHKDKIDLSEEERASIINIENENNEQEFNQFRPKISNFIKNSKKNEEDKKLQSHIIFRKSKKNEVVNKFKDIFLKSSLIKEEEDIDYLIGLFKQKIKNFHLLYKMTQDGENTFHEKCDNISQTLSLIKIGIKNNNLIRFNNMLKYGGYTEEKWDKSKKAKKDSKSFIFSFSNKSEPFFASKENDFSIICSPEYGPSFGYSNKSPELWIKGKKGGYDNTLTFGDEMRICTGGAKVFDVIEIEVYQIIFE